jgi:hypothetical protein
VTPDTPTERARLANRLRKAAQRGRERKHMRPFRIDVRDATLERLIDGGLIPASHSETETAVRPYLTALFEKAYGIK